MLSAALPARRVTAALRRRRVPAALVAALSLAGCSGNGGDQSAPTTTPTVAATNTSSATSVGVRVLTAAMAARADTGPTGAAARVRTFTGAALQSANAWANTLPVRSTAEKAETELATASAQVIGASRPGDTPRQLLLQTTRTQNGAAVLVLLVSPDAAADFQVAAITPMVAKARVDALDPTTTGSPPVGAGEGLAAKPDAVVSAFAEAVKFPGPERSDLLAPDPLSDQLRRSAAAQSQAIAAQGSFASSHDPRGIVGGLRLQGGAGAIVFAHLQRHDSIAFRKAASLTPSKEVTVLSGLRRITTEAKLISNEMVAVVIPAAGPSRVVAFSNQLLGATGR